MAADADNPYCYSGAIILRNKLGIRDTGTLQRAAGSQGIHRLGRSGRRAWHWLSPKSRAAEAPHPPSLPASTTVSAI